MITFGPMPPLAAPHRARRVHARARGAWRIAPLLATLGLFAMLAPQPAKAQAPLSHSDDAAPVPAGALRLRMTTAWTRYDERFGENGTLVPLGVDFSSDALGVAQFPRLAPIETGLRTLAGDPQLRVSLGRLEVRGGARIVTTPISLEYGVTRRLSVGVQVPIVQTRRVVQLRVNTDSAALANVGFVPATFRASAAAQNLAVAAAFQRDADRLAALLSSCPSNPGAPECASVNADPAAAAAARQSAQDFANAVATLGRDAASLLLAPRDKSALGDAIDARRQAINQQLQQFLGATAGSASGIFTATTDFSYIDLQGRSGTPGLLQSALGGGLDSLRTTDRLGIGDISVGAQYLLFDRFAHDTLPPRALQTRMVIGGAVRFGTSRPDSALNLVDIATGDGPGVVLHSAMDLIVGRLGGTVAARYVKSFARTVTAPLFGDPAAPFPYPAFGQRRRTAGEVIGLDLTPRYLVGESFAIDAHYGFERIGAATYDAPDLSLVDLCVACAVPPVVVTSAGAARTAQRAGIGLRYSTVDSWARGRARYPIEVSLTHLETLTGDAGLPKSSRDQVQVRIYYQLRR
jgi:hypothetical protein